VLATGWATALAQEAALKCRESADMGAEAYASGEYRHGPISSAAGRDADLPVHLSRSVLTV
jgi:glutamine---fructose-6-phosphate transaminase (isomerizing)